jgi:hypothetical protein
MLSTPAEVSGTSYLQILLFQIREFWYPGTGTDLNFESNPAPVILWTVMLQTFKHTINVHKFKKISGTGTNIVTIIFRLCMVWNFF